MSDPDKPQSKRDPATQRFTTQPPPRGQGGRPKGSTTRLLPRKGQNEVRNLIDATAIVGKMQAFGLGHLDAETGKPVHMSRDQVTACVALLRKICPDQAAVTHSGDAANPISTSLTISFKRPEVPAVTIEHGPVVATVEPRGSPGVEAPRVLLDD